jgi:hypothetical protein
MKRFFAPLVALALAFNVFLPIPAAQADEIRDIAFPVDGAVTFYDDFGEPRAGHPHEGIDILGQKMMPLLSAVDGKVVYVVFPEATWGYEIVIRDSERYTYHYIHINNDTPGTDDGLGGYDNAYAPGIQEGATVTRGQLVAWMGDSGNAENVGAHLHFEIHKPDGSLINPYQSLLAAYEQGSFDPATAKAASPDINADRGLQLATGTFCVSGNRIKTATSKAVYYCGADGKRYVFPNDKTYFSWYTNFLDITTVSDATLAMIPLGGNVTYRPGVKMVKIQTDPKVYAVDHGGVLRWVTSAELAAGMYGSTWASKVDDISDAFFVNYTVGQSITSLPKL